MFQNKNKFKLQIEVIKGYSFVFILFLVLINSNSLFGQIENNQKSSQLEDALNWSAKDSIILDMKNKQTHLYSEAHIDYGEIILDACYIKFDFESKIVHAKYCLDSDNQKIGKPILSDGSTSTTSDSLKYNFKTITNLNCKLK